MRGHGQDIEQLLAIPTPSTIIDVADAVVPIVCCCYISFVTSVVTISRCSYPGKLCKSTDVDHGPVPGRRLILRLSLLSSPRLPGLIPFLWVDIADGLMQVVIAG